MKKKIGFSIIIGLIILIILLAINQEESIRKKTFHVDNGFGYLIISEEKILIKQSYIPAIQENKPFYSKEDADKVANLVINKLQNKTSPTVSLKELTTLNIQTNALQ